MDSYKHEQKVMNWQDVSSCLSHAYHQEVHLASTNDLKFLEY